MTLIHSHHDHIPAYGKDSDHPEDMHVRPGHVVRVTSPTRRHIYVDGRGAEKAVLRLGHGSKLTVSTILLDGPNARLETDGPIGADIIWRDMPIDTAFDPEQFGGGLLCIDGEIDIRGVNPRVPFAVSEQPLRAGVSVIVLKVPESWQAGDEIVIPDTRQPVDGNDLGKHIERRRIKSITPPGITLDRPLEFDHPQWIHPETGEVKQFKIANVTQSFVMRSENPNGSRGHFLATGNCHIRIDGLLCKDMGRTTVEPLDSTKWDPHTGIIEHLGLQQIGRYAGPHLHGMPGRPEGIEWTDEEIYQFILNCIVVDGSPKLGIVLHHSTHYGLVQNFAIVGCLGSSFTTETPNVYDNVIRDGIIIGPGVGSGDSMTSRAGRNQAGGDHWHNSVGLGLQSAMNEFHRIDIYDHVVGIGMVGHGTTALVRPIVRGDHTDKPGTFEHILRNHMGNEKEYPFLPSSNVRVWGCWKAVEAWSNNCHEDTPRMFPGLEIIHSTIPTDFQDQRETYLEDWHRRGDFSKLSKDGVVRSFGSDFKPGYRFGITMKGGSIQGYDAAYNYVLDDDHTIFDEVHIDCPLAAYHPLGRYDKLAGPSSTRWLKCTWGHTAKLLMGGNYPKFDLRHYLSQARVGGDASVHTLFPLTYLVAPWKDGRDYRLYHYEQLASFELPPIPADKAYGDWPAGVWSHQQLIERGLAIFGVVIPETAFQREDFGVFWAEDITPEPPPALTLEDRVERLERAVFVDNP